MVPTATSQIASHVEVVDGRGGTQDFGQNVKCKRTFVVTLNDPTTPVTDIAAECGISWLDQHPEFPTYCTAISCQQDGDPLHYKVEFTYDLLKPNERHADPLARTDKVTFSGSTTSGPAIVHYNYGSPQLIVNSAGDPLPGAEKEYSQWNIQISGNRATFPKALAMACINCVNSDSWGGFAAGTLKVQSINGQLEIEQVDDPAGPKEKTYWSVSVEIAYRQEGWDLKVWDVGFNQLVWGGGRKKILDALNEPVSEPVALSNGSAKNPGSPPDMLTFKVYNRVSFGSLFTNGLPS